MPQKILWHNNRIKNFCDRSNDPPLHLTERTNDMDNSYTVPTRQELMASPSVHSIVKELLRRSKDYDCVDYVYDIELALVVLRKELDKTLNISK